LFFFSRIGKKWLTAGLKVAIITQEVATKKGGVIMISAGIKEVKNNLSRLLAQVKAGEEILITKRGKPVARIIKENHGDKSIRAALEPLVQRGLVTLPSRSILKDRISAIEALGKPVSEMVIENRR
jgi:prevent-host-death family protein